MALITLLLLLPLISAAPSRWSARKGNTTGNTTTLTLPSGSLPPPPSNSTLRYIALGLGHQNYTCANTSAVPVSIGATARLFDIESILHWHPLLTTILPPLTLSWVGLPLETVAASDTTQSAADFARMLPGPLVPIGEHFFDSPTGLPTFNLHGADLPARLETTKVASVAAPASACKGADDLGAVAWLALLADDNSSNYGGVTTVYRVETAGGMSPATCAGVPPGDVIRVPYTAEYWFWGDEVDE
jgi:Protein of unknown function (DUF3455)